MLYEIVPRNLYLVFDHWFYMFIFLTCAFLGIFLVKSYKKWCVFYTGVWQFAK